MATWSGDSAGERCNPAGHPQGVPLRSSGIGPTGRLETALPVGDWKSPLRAKNTGRLKHAPPSRRVKHAAPSGARKDADPSRRRGRRRSCRASGIGSFKEKEEGGTGKSPLLIPRETGRGLSVSGAHRVAAVERLVGATLVVALPPNGATVRRPLPGHCRTRGWSGVFQAPTGNGVLPGAGNGDVERRHGRGTMRPRRAPTRGAPTVIGNWSDRAARNRPSSGRLEVAPPGKEHGARETRPSQSARETRRSKRRPEGRRSQSAPRTTPLLPGVRHWKFQRKRRRGDRKVPPPDPARNRAGIVRQRRPPRCRCRTSRRGDPCGRPPPERRHRPPAIAWALPDRGGGAATF